MSGEQVRSGTSEPVPGGSRGGFPAACPSEAVSLAEKGRERKSLEMRLCFLDQLTVGVETMKGC